MLPAVSPRARASSSVSVSGRKERVRLRILAEIAAEEAAKSENDAARARLRRRPPMHPSPRLVTPRPPCSPRSTPRVRCSAMLRSKSWRYDISTDIDRERAAIRIQACFRGARVRRHLRIIRCAVVPVSAARVVRRVGAPMLKPPAALEGSLPQPPQASNGSRAVVPLVPIAQVGVAAGRPICVRAEPPRAGLGLPAVLAPDVRDGSDRVPGGPSTEPLLATLACGPDLPPPAAAVSPLRVALECRSFLSLLHAKTSARPSDASTSTSGGASARRSRRAGQLIAAAAAVVGSSGGSSPRAAAGD
jgi:hypothetical protein